MLCLTPLALAALSSALQDAPRPVDIVRAEARAVVPLVETIGARRFLKAAESLPEVESRDLWIHRAERRALRPEEYAARSEAERGGFEATKLDESFYYNTRYGSPIAYARVLDLAARADERFAELGGLRVFDFGYGGIGHLRMLASIGCDVVGVEVDDTLRALYGPADQGTIAPVDAAWTEGRAHSLRLVHGQWPAEAAVVEAVGGGFDLVLSKNVLKLGYVTPRQPVDARMRIDLGVTPEAFLQRVADVLAPGGLFAIYNLCPAQTPDRYLPWADGESPFSREQFESVGLAVVTLDQVDDEGARELGHALGWDEQGMDLDGDLFAWLTIARKPG